MIVYSKEYRDTVLTPVLKKGGGNVQKEKCPKYLSKLYGKTYSSSALLKFLKALDIAIVLFSALVFALLVYFAFAKSAVQGAFLLVAAAVPFVLVSSLRVIVSSPRPYEVYDLSEFTNELPHYKRGESFPSRHVFSAFLIGVLALKFVVPLGIVTMALGSVLAFLRVSLGIHFIKDVAAGMLIGVLTGLVGMMIL